MAKHLASLLFLILAATSSATGETAERYLTLLTEENHPHSVQNLETGEIEGIAVDIALSLMAAAKINYSLTMLPWNRAFRRAQTEKNTCVFATNRTPEREHLFQWISPTHVGGWALYQRPDSKFSIENIDDIKALAIVGRNKSPATDKLELALKSKILRTESNEDAARLLYRGRADLWISGVFDGPASTQKAGLPDPKLVLHWMPATFGIACSHATDTILIEALNAANKRRLATP